MEEVTVDGRYGWDLMGWDDKHWTAGKNGDITFRVAVDSFTNSWRVCIVVADKGLLYWEGDLTRRDLREILPAAKSDFNLNQKK